MTLKFEFDPYFCDSSCLSELSLVLKKLKNIKNLSLIIRRLDNPQKDNAIDVLGPNIYKLQRLKNIKIEFLNVSNLNEYHHILPIYRALQKCHLLTSFEWVVTECPMQSLKYYEAYMKLMKKLQKLQYYKDYTIIQKGTPNSNLSFAQGFNDPPKIPSLRYLDMIYVAAKEWTNMGAGEGGLVSEAYAQYISRHPNLEKFKCKIIRNYILYDEILSFFKSFILLSKFWYLDFELLNCRLGDQELLIIAYCLSLIPQLRYIRFKFIQSIPLSIEGIEQFVDLISKMKNIERFDLYFRKLNISSRDIPRLERMFSRFPGVNCSFCPQSVLLSKNNSIQ